MASRVTILEVAKEAVMGPSTVSKVLNDQRVSEKKRQAALEAIKKLNYRPNLIARNLRTNISKTHLGYLQQLFWADYSWC